MAYWLTGKNATGAANICEFVMDSNDDLSSLPTSIADGADQGDGVSHHKVDKGSTAFSIGSSTKYVLNSSNVWTEI